MSIYFLQGLRGKFIKTSFSAASQYPKRSPGLPGRGVVGVKKQAYEPETCICKDMTIATQVLIAFIGTMCTFIKGNVLCGFVVRILV